MPNLPPDEKKSREFRHRLNVNYERIYSLMNLIKTNVNENPTAPALVEQNKICLELITYELLLRQTFQSEKDWILFLTNIWHIEVKARFGFSDDYVKTLINHEKLMEIFRCNVRCASRDVYEMCESFKAK